MMILGIETSCDETAAAVVRDDRAVLSDIVLSQLDEHRAYGGVVPEIAARTHLDHLDRLIRRALDEAAVRFEELDGIAATGGPGLIGGLLVGVMTAKAIAAVLERPFLAINHLEGHALTARLTDGLPFPYLLLLVSGGHCQLLAVEGVGRYRRLGTTMDDAVGEAFDKAAKALGLGYPGGPLLEAAARQGNASRFSLPRPMLRRPGCDFSFSGLKTALRQMIDALPGAPTEQDVADISAAFLDAVGDILVDRTRNAIELFAEAHPRGDTLVVAGGVAANHSIRARLRDACEQRGLRFVAPPLRLCTDNAAMIAWAGIERLGLGWTDGMEFAPKPRWPLDPNAANIRGVRKRA